MLGLEEIAPAEEVAQVEVPRAAARAEAPEHDHLRCGEGEGEGEGGRERARAGVSVAAQPDAVQATGQATVIPLIMV